jgi:acyl-CoA reductase-like NAD-dependent aldehyde dehydrogenase
MHDVQLMIGGADRPAEGGRTFDRRDPVTGEVATRAAAASVADARAAVDAAADAFPAWSAMGPSARRKALLDAADAMDARAGDFVEAMMHEAGAAEPWARFNVGLAANMLREAAALTTQVTGDVIPSDVPGSLAMAIRQPVGVVLGIAPWNAPVILGTRAVATPLACGNTVVLKASELCPRTHRLIAECLRQGGAPEGVIGVVSNDPEDAAEVVEALIAHPAVKRVNFTGSTRVGRIIARACAEHLKPVLLELGGKAPMLVLDDADLDAAVDAAAFGAYMNQGQICMSTERIIVDEKVADAFVEKLAAKAGSITAGDPREGATILASLVDEGAAARVAGMVDDAKAKGARVPVGGGHRGPLMDATVVDGVTKGMRLYGEESFGPVVSVIRVGGDEEAIATANDSEYGLSSAVFTRDIARGLAVARRIEAGICHVNGPTVHDEAQMPFGGVKASGHGRFGGTQAIAEFTELRWVTVQTGPRHYPF